MSHNVPLYKPQGGDTLVVATGAQVDVRGGRIISNGSQAGAIADVPTAGSATAAANATAINAMLAALRGVGIIAAS